MNNKLDDDGMEFLRKKREEAQALVEMQTVAQMQAVRIQDTTTMELSIRDEINAFIHNLTYSSLSQDLAQTVSSRMKTIDSLLTGGPSSSTSSDARHSDLATARRDDDEVNTWKKKIAELSAPTDGNVSRENCDKNSVRDGRGPAPQLLQSPTDWTPQNVDDQCLARSSPTTVTRTLPSSSTGRRPTALPAQPEIRSNRVGAYTSPPKPPAATPHEGRQPSRRSPPSQSHSSPLQAIDVTPSAQLPGLLGGPLPDQSSRVDAEVDYWRRKIAELSAPSDRSADGGFHSTSLPASLSPSMPRSQGQPPLMRLNLSRPKYKTVSYFICSCSMSSVVLTHYSFVVRS